MNRNLYEPRSCFNWMIFKATSGQDDLSKEWAELVLSKILAGKLRVLKKNEQCGLGFGTV